PARRPGTSPGMGQRRSGRRSTTRSTRRPVRCGARPRRVVSTSGSSGMGCKVVAQARRCKVAPECGPRRRLPEDGNHHRLPASWLAHHVPAVALLMPSSLLDFLAGGLLQFGPWQLLLVLLVATQLTIFSVTLYLHRSQAHRGGGLHPVAAHFFRFWTWPTPSMITREWVAIHRKHHAKRETEEAPHSPMHKRIGTVFWRGVELYREARGMRADIEQ